MPRVARRSEALTTSSHVRKIDFDGSKRNSNAQQQYPVTTTTIDQNTHTYNFKNMKQSLSVKADTDNKGTEHIDICDQSTSQQNRAEECLLPRQNTQATYQNLNKNMSDQNAQNINFHLLKPNGGDNHSAHSPSPNSNSANLRHGRSDSCSRSRERNPVASASSFYYHAPQASPHDKHIISITNCLETIKAQQRLQNQNDDAKYTQETIATNRSAGMVNLEIFECLEKELQAIVETYGRERDSKKREIDQMRQLLTERDQLLQQAQSERNADREHLLGQWRMEKLQVEQNNEVLQITIQKKEKDYQKLQKQLRKKEDEYLKLSEDHKNLMEEKRGTE